MPGARRKQTQQTSQKEVPIFTHSDPQWKDNPRGFPSSSSPEDILNKPLKHAAKNILNIKHLGDSILKNMLFLEVLDSSILVWGFCHVQWQFFTHYNTITEGS